MVYCSKVSFISIPSTTIFQDKFLLEASSILLQDGLMAALTWISSSHLHSIFDLFPEFHLFLSLGSRLHGEQDFPAAFQRRMCGVRYRILVENKFFFLRLWKTLLSFSSAFQYFSEESILILCPLWVTCHFFSLKSLDLFFFSLIVLKLHDDGVGLLPSILVSSLFILEIGALQF